MAIFYDSMRNFLIRHRPRLQRAIFLLGASLAVAPCSSADLGVQPEINCVKKQFYRLDSIFAQLCGAPQSKMKEVAPAETLFRQTVVRYPIVKAILRSNSKGIIVNQVCSDSALRLSESNVADRPWYRACATTSERFYDLAVTAGGRPFFIWSRPLKVTVTSGRLRFAGVVAIKIDCQAFFNQCAAETAAPFQVFLGDKPLFSTPGSMPAHADKQSLGLPGMERLTLRFTKQNAAAALDKTGKRPAMDSSTQADRAAPNSAALSKVNHRASDSSRAAVASSARSPGPGAVSTVKRPGIAVGFIIVFLLFITVIVAAGA
ncbi:MAG: hypothetical protein PHC61_10835, partial [Chitinivibrionales bacterium]|nr:hypothetical protein [Chitinivibrionales bacterium]